jgi:hypothetical protein
MKSRMRQFVIAVVALVAWVGIVHALESTGAPDLFGEGDGQRSMQISRSE